jgi:predicted regulator of amino acid metabolism with ACT domain
LPSIFEQRVARAVRVNRRPVLRTSKAFAARRDRRVLMTAISPTSSATGAATCATGDRSRDASSTVSRIA